MPETDMSRCWDVANFCPLVVFVAGIRVVEFSSYCTQRNRDALRKTAQYINLILTLTFTHQRAYRPRQSWTKPVIMMRTRAANLAYVNTSWTRIDHFTSSAFTAVSITNTITITAVFCYHMHNNTGNNNNNKHDNVYGAVIVAKPLREFTRFIWWMWNGAKRTPTLRPGQTTRAVSPPVGCQKPHPPSPFIIITQLESWYSFYRPTESRRLSRPRHCSKGVQPVPKAVYRCDVYDKHATAHGGIRTLVLSHRSQAC